MTATSTLLSMAARIRNHEEPADVKVMKKATVADDLVDRLAEEVKKNERIIKPKRYPNPVTPRPHRHS
jgi:hypothetical protein